MNWTVASDIDGTLTGDRGALDRLALRLRQSRALGDLCLILSTGRRLEQVVQGMADEGLPEPDYVMCQVGTEIYQSPLHEASEALPAWREKLLAQYSRQEARRFLTGIEGLVMQPDIFNTELKTSCFLDQCPEPETAAAEIGRRVAPYSDRYQVIWSSGRDLDILPADSGKGKAIRFLIEQEGLEDEPVVVAGDTGNDIAMFEEFERGVVVANAKPELVEQARALKDSDVYYAQQPFAGGVEEGLEHFGVLRQSTGPV
ncbi:MAG: HAD-IIB family hydrolase [Pirellulales bacterium]|nr:HAD-IIB family hydrolase [Pirellulales bacterium]